ncbi:MAG TPA: 2-C-methyl-D-erythritol 2,4-cyclodiphosphate synthase [Candidatus Sumerlaeota bacterium]|nr:MAG: 2-C-methyl-D-erythritol 2,4-cyclodiphosphate synthase [candidate division BRC1 bacterium ADurb.Bin183]HOE62687.1 2-C-methyl-D-erythritol 2,4-cyclodiphosphate synthase [Candidatus Sumerlaeota bacterium]HRR29993.1 2-C-methyl-D-erythritol 2,4-cyclodiphosphate synthase [Candidatus Sumerlaeia bacterium]HON49447.1 2-C-methyl-D-erythritol 2,4-cyclodiphosphate synthase [Candidatus Sumerlaeota bacterium]HOR64803.1 2-C-methyl-D-erythritol 2,4-cyclodiphosphate synthase [Candidatus Sumerlaeota bact
MSSQNNIHHRSYIPFRIGQGFDAHRFIKGRSLILGGVEIPFEMGLEGHSDADVLVHAIMDALLGAAGLGDIGRHFPPSDPAYKNIYSLDLLERVSHLLSVNCWNIVNIDSIIICEAPRIAPHMESMRENIRGRLSGLPDVSIKATTTEKMGFTGRGEGVAALAVALISSTKEDFHA